MTLLSRILIPLTLGAASIGATLLPESSATPAGRPLAGSRVTEVALLVAGALLVLVALLPLLTALVDPRPGKRPPDR